MQEPKKRRLPPWFKVKAPGGDVYREVKSLVRELGLHTVCQSALCPNIGSCWDRRTATFLVLGGVCTRSCRFCGVPGGKPEEYDPGEAERVAEAVARMGLSYAVITSVTRDDLADGGSLLFARTIARIRERAPGCRVEVLVPDFKGDETALAAVMEAVPDVFAHNVETVPRLYRRVRPGARYERSVDLLRDAGLMNKSVLTKSGIMLGLGETEEEVITVMKDLVAAGVHLFTIGQYLRPSKESLPVERFIHPYEFEELKRIGLSIGFSNVSSGPLVRSSYLAEEQAGDEIARFR